MKIEAKIFEVPEQSTNRITTQTHNEHLNLYSGYIKNSNLILEKLTKLSLNPTDHVYEIGELSRRFSFEYNGVKNHEFYFEQLLGGSREISINSLLYKKITQQWGSWESWLTQFALLAKTRGVGWAILYYDDTRDILLNSWIDEQHIGHLNSCQFIYGIDLWEHSYVNDYLPSGKSQYITDYITSTNWEIVSARIKQ